MKLATIRTGDTTTAARIVGDGRAVALGAEDVGAVLRTGTYEEGEEFTFAPADLAPVIPRPGKIICVGLNYAKHIAEMGHEQPDVPTLFIKFPEALIGAHDNAEVPDFNADALDFEGELAVIIGSRARHTTDGAKHIAGYSVINDCSQREYQTARSSGTKASRWRRRQGSGRGWTPNGSRGRPSPPRSTVR